MFAEVSSAVLGGGGSSGLGCASVSEDFSSTPWPLHSGHELRPVVSHCKFESSADESEDKERTIKHCLVTA